MKDKIKEYWEKEDTTSLRDENLRELEMEAIVKCIQAINKKNLYICDVGCGDGTNTIHYSQLNNVKHIIGLDYSSTMINKANEKIKERNIKNITFINSDLSVLNNYINKFDIMITQRCLINLPTFSEQTNAIKMIYNSLDDGGYYFMLEASKDGLDKLNKLRAGLSLDSLKMPWHNNYFDIKALEETLEKYFSILIKKDFAIYYLYTRILNQLLGLDINDELSKKIDIAAAKVQRQYEENFLGIGAQSLFVLRKK